MKNIQKNFKESSKHQIDQLVYKLYGLSGEEIRLIEEN